VSLLQDMLPKEGDEKPKKKAKTVAMAQLLRSIDEKSLEGWFSSLKSDVANKILSQLELDLPDSAKDKGQAFSVFAAKIGLEAALVALDEDQLKEVVKAGGLDEVKTPSKALLADYNITGKFVEKERYKAEKPHKSRPDIEKGINKADLQQHYWKEDLVQFCKQNNLRATGNKKELINRIVKHFEGQSDRPAPSKKRKADDSTTDEKPSKKRKKDSEDKKTDGEEKKTEGEEKKAEAEKPAQKKKSGRKGKKEEATEASKDNEAEKSTTDKEETSKKDEDTEKSAKDKINKS